MSICRLRPGEEHFGPIRFVPGRNKGRYPFEFGERAHMKKHLEQLMGQGVVGWDGERTSRRSET